MFNLLLFLLSPFLALAGAGNVITTPVSTAPGNVSFLNSSACWAPDPSNTLAITQEMLDGVHGQYPATPVCGTGATFNSPQGVLGNYTLVRRNTNLIRFKTDTEGGPYMGGCEAGVSAIRYIGNLPDGRTIWWTDTSYKNGKLDGLIYIETGNDSKSRTYDVYAHERILEDPAASGHGHILECFVKGGIIPVVEENAELLPPQVVSFTNESQFTNNGKRPYVDVTGFEENYSRFAILPNATQEPGTIGPTIPPTASVFPPTMHYLIKIEQADESLPKKAVNQGRIGSVRGTSGGNAYEYEVFFHGGEFYLRDPKDNTLFIYESSVDAPGGDVNRNPSLQLGVLNFRVSNEWSPYTPSCKPAIYLYPEKPTDLSVQILPDGYLTASIPSYDGVWNVKANPSGTIEADNGTYPYLYYEANIRNLRIPKEGWVIKQEELSTFFDEKLARLGLNENEAIDFKEYWVPKLSGKPYYFVTLVSKDELNRKETLIFSKQPDTMIRIRMVFEGLDSPITVSPLILPETPKRAGFTAVDWGGGELGGTCEGGVAKEIGIR